MPYEEQILICAVRYALGRMSYMVSVVCEYAATKKPELSKECINIIIRDIEMELSLYHYMGGTLGMECDENNWLWLLKVLKNDI